MLLGQFLEILNVYLFRKIIATIHGGFFREWIHKTLHTDILEVNLTFGINFNFLSSTTNNVECFFKGLFRSFAHFLLLSCLISFN